MSNTNGQPLDFTRQMPDFVLEGHRFQLRKVNTREWSETLNRGAAAEQKEIDKKEGGLLLAVSEEGMHELVKLALSEEDRAEWERIRSTTGITFGEVNALRRWIWEQMTERPFTSDTPSFDGPGSNEQPSEDAEASPVGTPTN